jgi:hypothetical protein
MGPKAVLSGSMRHGGRKRQWHALTLNDGIAAAPLSGSVAMLIYERVIGFELWTGQKRRRLL